MAGKFIEIDEAARMLGVTADEIKRLVDRKEIPQPLRGTDPPKFRQEDIERAIKDRAAGSGIGSLMPDLEFDNDSILLSEKELGQSVESASSTIIGKGSPHGPVTDSDIRIAGDPSLSDVTLAADLSGVGSDVRLVLGGSDAKKSMGSDAKKAGKSDSKKKTPPDDDLHVAPSGSGVGASDLLKFAEDEVRLADLSGTGSSKKGRKDTTAKKSGNVQPMNYDDDDDVLSVKPGSDITRGAQDSGIHLVDRQDSGISLDEPLMLGGSNKELLELGEADVISLEEATDMEGATQLRSDEDFLLTPAMDTGGDESDSGSQVIALDADEDSSGVFTPASSGMVAMLEEDAGGTPLGGTVTAGGALMSSSLVTTPAIPEAPFSGWAVTGLVCCALLLLMTGMVMQDIVHNIWRWDGVGGVSASIFDSIEKTIGWMDK